MLCENKKTQTQSPSEESEAAPVRKGKFLRLAGTADLEDAHERKLQNQRRYKAKLKSETRIDGRLFRFVFRNPEYRRVESTVNWPEVFATRRPDAMTPIPLSKHFAQWAATGNPSTLKFLSVLAVLNYQAICNIKHSHVLQLLFKRIHPPLSKEKKKEVNARYREYRKAYYQKRRTDPEYAEMERKRAAESFQKNKVKIYARIKARKPITQERDRAYICDWQRRKRRDDPQYNVGNRLRSRMWHALVAGKGKKAAKTETLIGCSIAMLRSHIEKQFTNGMSWELLLAGEIHLDHIRPCASFDLSKEDEQRRCFHYTNLQPLWWQDNLSKGDKLPA